MEPTIKKVQNQRIQLYVIKGKKVEREEKRKKFYKRLFFSVLYLAFVSIVSFVLFTYIQIVKKIL